MKGIRPPDTDRHQPLEQFIATADFSPYAVILLVGPLRHKSSLKIPVIARNLSTPLFYIQSRGFYSQFSLQLPEVFPIIETHPDPASMEDVRLLKPWPELLEFMKEKTEGLEQQSAHDHGHVPYLLLLLYYLEQWKATHEGRCPENYKEKSAFRELVKSGARTDNAEGGEENYDEAVAAVLKSLNPPAIPSGLREVFDDENCKSPKEEVGSIDCHSALRGEPDRSTSPPAFG
jgi:NEDD8-activating enzyme E1 regulatory subunit